MGVKGNNSAPIKIVLGCKDGPGVKLTGSCFIKYCTLFCIEPARFQHEYAIFSSSNVNLKAVASLSAILYSFAFVFVYLLCFFMIITSYCI